MDDSQFMFTLKHKSLDAVCCRRGKEAIREENVPKSLQQFIKVHASLNAAGSFGPFVFRLKSKKKSQIPSGTVRVFRVPGISPHAGPQEEDGYLLVVPFIADKTTETEAKQHQYITRSKYTESKKQFSMTS